MLLFRIDDVGIVHEAGDRLGFILDAHHDHVLSAVVAQGSYTCGRHADDAAFAHLVLLAIDLVFAFARDDDIDFFVGLV